MVKDVYFVNRYTGELLPGCEAIHDFYKTHGALEAWTDEWEETKLEVESGFLEAPNFAGTLSAS